MNPKWLVPIALTLGLLGLAGASKQVAQVQLWLDKRDGPETAKASALAPIISKQNRGSNPSVRHCRRSSRAR